MLQPNDQTDEFTSRTDRVSTQRQKHFIALLYTPNDK